MNSYLKRSLSFRRTIKGHPRSQLLHASQNRSRETPHHRHPRAVVLLPINSWPTLPKKSTSSASASFPQVFREPRRTLSRCPLPSRRLRLPRRGRAVMDKGRPAIAAIWYERALKTPGNDPESTLALRYDLGVAQEWAGETEAALKSFSQVYAMNSDYRDVAERIAALQKPIR